MIHHCNRLVLSIAVILFTGAWSSSAIAHGHNAHPIPEIVFGEITYGTTPQYHEQNGKLRQDLSGAAYNGRILITVDDGGKPSEYDFLRRMTPDLENNTDENAFMLNQPHRDLEGASWGHGWFFVTTSLSATGDEKQDYRWLTRFRAQGLQSDPRLQESVDLRDELMDALWTEFGDEWFNRIETKSSKAGGLNIEGLAVHPHRPNSIVWGIRSPLFGDTFATEDVDGDRILDEGRASIATVDRPFDAAPRFAFETLDLDGHGVRSFEYSPVLRGYVIISGPAMKADGYSLWFWSDHGDLIPLDLPGFDQLCRPEGIVQAQDSGVPYLLVLSEESGAACNGAEYTYIRAEIDTQR